MCKGVWFCSMLSSKNILGIGSYELSWGDVKKIKSGKIYFITSYIQEKQSIVYTPTCIESVCIGRNDSGRNLNACHWRHIWNDDDEVFDHQLEEWGVVNIIKNKLGYITNELRTYIEDW